MAATSKSLSPNQAARQAGVSRWTINRAVAAKELHATRDNKRAWHIEQADLDAWMNSSAFMLRTAAQHAAQQTADNPTTAPTAPPPYPDLRADVRAVEVECGHLRERLAATEALMRERLAEAERRMHERVSEVQADRDDARAERDRAHEDRKQLLALVEKLTTEASQPWWARLFGRRG